MSLNSLKGKRKKKRGVLDFPERRSEQLAAQPQDMDSTVKSDDLTVNNPQVIWYLTNPSWQ
jgi:hypothetical protein